MPSPLSPELTLRGPDDPLMHMPMAVVVGDHTQGLGIVRSAAAAGAAVWVVNDKSISLARFSRYVSGYKRLARGTLTSLGRTRCAEHLKEALLDIPFGGLAALFGVNEDITRCIHQHRSSLSSRYLIPDVRLDAIYDKFTFNKLVPKTAQIDTRLCSEIDFGIVADPNRFLLKGRCGNAFRQITGQKAVCLARFTKDARQRLFRRLAPDQVVLQEIVNTRRPVVSVCSFSMKGQVAGLFGYEKLRQHPNCFGTGTYLRSIPVDLLKPVAEAILRRLHFTGISEVEFIHDPNMNSYRVIEMNPRTWKSVHFATQCGQNLVARHLSFLAGGRMGSSDGYVKDRYWADLATDLLQMLRERRIGRYHRGFFECTWDRSDPLPAVILWTLFPLIGLENLLSRLRRAVSSAGPCNLPTVNALQKRVSAEGRG